MEQALCRHGVSCTRIPYEPCSDFDWLPDARRKFYGSVRCRFVLGAGLLWLW